MPKALDAAPETSSLPAGPAEPVSVAGSTGGQPVRKKWQPKSTAPDKPAVSEAPAVESSPADTVVAQESVPGAAPEPSPPSGVDAATGRRKWQPKKGGPALP
jgi:hypothetical protein